MPDTTANAALDRTVARRPNLGDDMAEEAKAKDLTAIGMGA
jgi:hypothetical protein